MISIYDYKPCQTRDNSWTNVQYCSLGEISDSGQSCQCGEVKIFPLEFVDDIADDIVVQTRFSTSKVMAI